MQLIKRRGTLVVVSAPSGAGKTTLCHEVRALVPDLYYSVSYTTREPRPGEKNGVDFFFVTEGVFTAMRGRDEFAEWAQVHGHLYGTPAKALEGALSRGLDVLLDIDTHGARKRYRCSSWRRPWRSSRRGCASATATPRATSPGA
jgi:guanylate kinase